MIFRVWVQIIAIFIIASAPLFLLNYLQQEETLQLTLESGPGKMVEQKIPQAIRQLKTLAALVPEKAADYFSEYQEWTKLQTSFVEWENLKPIIQRRLQITTLAHAILLLGLMLLLSYFVARSITRKFHKLLEEQSLSLQRRAELQSLAQWQESARILVHELRGPLTPVKLITSSLAQDSESNTQLEDHREGLQMALQKIQQLESMIQKFMNFAKLPEVRPEARKLSAVVNYFITHYQESFKDQLLFESPLLLANEPLILIDEELFHNALFSIAQNAREALPPDRSGILRFHYALVQNLLCLKVTNTGTTIPKDIIPRLFQIGASSKLDRHHNFGIGLAMAKKIMLDHQGNLRLIENSSQKGVTFEFSFPLIPDRNAQPEQSPSNQNNHGPSVSAEKIP